MQLPELSTLLVPGKQLVLWDATKSPKIFLSPKQLGQHATKPPASEMNVIIVVPIGCGHEDIPVHVVAAKGANSLTVGDVLDALHDAMSKLVDVKAWDTTSANFKEILNCAAGAAGGKPGDSYKGTPRVVDLFVNKTKLAGLAFDDVAQHWLATFDT